MSRTDQRVSAAGLLPAAAVVVAVLAPLRLESAQVSVLITAMAVAVVALGLDLLVGSTGQLSLAHAAFYGVGVYVALAVGTSGAPWALAFLAAAVCTGLAAAVVGLPSLRIGGLQVAVATLAFQLFAEQVPNEFPTIKSTTRTFERPEFLADDRSYYWFCLALLATVVVLLRRTRQTRAGRSFAAVRDLGARAAAFGIAPGRAKLTAYAWSGALAGLGGAMFALQQGSVGDTQPFVLQQSLLLVAMVVVGGARSAAGVITGAIAFVALPRLVPTELDLPVLGPATTGIPILFTMLLLLIVVRQPAGLAGWGRQAVSRLTRRGPHTNPRPAAPEPSQPHTATAAQTLRRVPRKLTERLPVAALLEAVDVGVRYGGVQALAGISLEVRRGEIVGLIGANGAGKSTFFNAVSGLAPVTGSIRFRDRELVTASASTRSAAGVARTFQDMGLDRGETVRNNVLLAQMWMARYPMAPGLLGLFGAAEEERRLRSRADIALELFGLEHLRGERLGDLPYGTMRIVEIAAAVAAGPDLLLLDEASAGLTPDEAHVLGDRFRDLRDDLGLTLVVIEHHVPLIAGVCDYCYCLESGRVIAEGTPAQVTAQPQVVESFLGRGSLLPAAAPARAEVLT